MRLLFAFFIMVVSAFSQDLRGQDLRGHGGPVHALSFHKNILASGSFDQSIILWDLTNNQAISVLKGHEGGVRSIIFQGDTLISGGDDGRVIHWQQGKPFKIYQTHKAKVTALALHPLGYSASSSFDGTTVIYKNEPHILQSRSEKLVGLAFNSDGTELITAGADGYITIFDTQNGTVKQEISLKMPVTCFLYSKKGFLVYGLSTGLIKITDAQTREINLGKSPVIALAFSKDEGLLAAASIGGDVAVYETKTFKKLYSLQGPGLPVWSLTFSETELLTGGGDKVIRRWDIKTGEHKGTIHMEITDPLKAFHGERGAELFRACAFCHGVTKDDIKRAGPSLYKIFGRKVAGDTDYLYSESLKQDKSFWTKEKLMSLFEKGPLQTYPGTKMPEQRINLAEDRQLLVDFIEKISK